MRDLNRNAKVVKVLAPVVCTAATSEAVADIDLKGFNSCMIVLSAGAKHASDTLNSTNKWTLKVEHADDDGTGAAGTYANVAAKDVSGATPASGVILSLDDAAKMATVHQFGYVGAKRFLKITLAGAGTIANGSPIGINLIKGNPAIAPV